jgi:hypothetical protein
LATIQPRTGRQGSETRAQSWLNFVAVLAQKFAARRFPTR